MSLRVWDEHVVPRLTDLGLCGRETREVACAGLTGRVLGPPLDVRLSTRRRAGVARISDRAA